MSMEFPQCAETCPALRKHTRHVQLHEEQIDEIIKRATSDDLEAYVETARERLESMLGPIDSQFLPDGMEENLAYQIRASGGELVNQLTTHNDGIRQQISHLALKCRGPLELSGSNDNRRQVTVTVCASPEAGDEENKIIDVKRNRI
ncbi:MAG: hypothetical protein WAQ27_02760 [Candidatus Microsaccharimonas sp.]